jgi:hypothetical protein
LSTPVFRLSGTSRAGTPPKNSNAAAWHSVQARWSILATGRTNMCREQHKTITNAQMVRSLPVAGSSQRPSCP